MEKRVYGNRKSYFAEGFISHIPIDFDELRLAIQSIEPDVDFKCVKHSTIQKALSILNEQKACVSSIKLSIGAD